MSPDPDKSWSEARAQDIKETFSNVIKECKNEGADLLLISGNLFNHQATSDELDFVNNLFKSIPETHILIVAGSNDHIKSNSPILNYEFSDNVHYYLNGTIDAYKIDSKNVVVHGLSYYSLEEPSSIINSVNFESDNLTHILMFYGGDSRHLPFDINKLNEKGFSYVALGLKHNYQEVVKNKIYYPGSPEPIDQNDEGDHGIIIGEIDNKTHELLSLSFKKLAKASYIPIVVKVNSKTTEADVVTLVTKEVMRLGDNNIFKIIIEGMRDPDIEFYDNMFSKKIKISSFEDLSNPKYDFIKLSSEHPQDMIGAFIRKMTFSSENPSDIEKNALYFGTHALLKSTERDD